MVVEFLRAFMDHTWDTVPVQTDLPWETSNEALLKWAWTSGLSNFQPPKGQFIVLLAVYAKTNEDR